jgi:amino acid transporter
MNAVLAQSAVALGLILLGALTRRGFETMVEYTAPVFWFFFLLTVASLIVLRRTDPQRNRPFRVPGYPVTPIVFCGVAAYLLYSSVRYAGVGALVGLVVLASGVFVMRLTAGVTPGPGETAS